MATNLIAIKGSMRVALFASLMFVVASFGPASALAQVAKDKRPARAVFKSKQAAAEESGAKPAEAADQEDSFTVPVDANAKELFKFISAVKHLRGNKIPSVIKSARAAVAGAEAIRDLEGIELQDEIRALREEFNALRFLDRYDPKSRGKMKSRLADLKNDERPEIARIATVEMFKLRIASARQTSKADQQQMVSELKSLIADREFDRVAFGLASELARAIGYSENSEVAASLYEDMAGLMSESKDLSLKSRAPKMLGAARRMRLPGNFMDVMGQTSDGNAFDWNAYRGKVVLVDFWASWCARCRREVPNMKRNLTVYGDRGFEIVGVNLDTSLEACEKYVDQEKLTWTNLISNKEGERGWDNPLASHYGISAIPTAILVDQEGQVVSLRARGTELDRLLAEFLGETKPSDEKTNAKVAEKAKKSDS